MVLFVAFACGDDGPSRKEIAQYDRLERAIGTLSEAPREDRDIRLKEMAGLKLESERVKKVQTLCVEAYRLFGDATEKLLAAKARTEATEVMLTEAKTIKDERGELPPDQEQKLIEMADKASSELKEVTATLDKAESAVAACEGEREKLHAYFSPTAGTK